MNCFSISYGNLIKSPGPSLKKGKIKELKPECVEFILLQAKVRCKLTDELNITVSINFYRSHYKQAGETFTTY